MLELLSRKEHVMCWQCDNPDKTIDDYFSEVRDTIRRHGWIVQFCKNVFTQRRKKKGAPFAPSRF